MLWYPIRTKTRKYFKEYGCLHFPRNVSKKYRKQLLDTRLNASNKLIHKAAKARGEF